MNTELGVFHFEEDKTSFEDLGKENGVTHWTEEVLMEALGYETAVSFRKAVMRAKQACLAAGMQCEEHFTLQPDGSHILTRFGCYLVAMNGSSAKPKVAAAQIYFARVAETFKNYLEHTEGIERILIRDELTEQNKTLSSSAASRGVSNYAIFQHKGYMGLYNMKLSDLYTLKGVKDGRAFLNRMGKVELAANLFRVTQTEEKIRTQNIRGQKNLEDAAFAVGRAVRKTMQENSQTRPEELPLAEDVNSVKKKIKGTSKKLVKQAKKKK